MARTKKSPKPKAPKKSTTTSDSAGKWGEDNKRLSREPADLLARFNEQEAKRYEKIVRIRERAERLGDKKTATAAKKIEKKLQSFASA